MKILVIDDEIKMTDFIKLGLREEGFVVDVANDGETGYSLAITKTHDLILLDVNLPDTNGITLCKRLRDEELDIPIIMLTVKNKTTDKVAGLNAGADDYIIKPFEFEELTARIRANLRASSRINKNILQVEDLIMDIYNQKVTRDNKVIELTSKEFSLLECLMRNAGNIVTRVILLERVWEYNYTPFTNALDVYINHLRNKIDKDYELKLIHTYRGRGYTIKA